VEMTEDLDKHIVDIAELATEMVRLGKNLLEISSVGMYVYFIENSTEGTDCGYVKKSRNKFWLEQESGVCKQLANLRDRIDRILESHDSNRSGLAEKD